MVRPCRRRDGIASAGAGHLDELPGDEVGAGQERVVPGDQVDRARSSTGVEALESEGGQPAEPPGSYGASVVNATMLST
ncbi:hypothetical protein CFP66_03545 [Pseudonocardia sp. MH-G8]|nr:hypothetical protein CFP66_03545 [Pseudonocardia sp. MH-G8]